MKKHLIITTFIAVILLLTAGAVGHRLGIQKGLEEGKNEGAKIIAIAVLNEIQQTNQLLIKQVNIDGKIGDLVLKITEFNVYE